MRFVRPPAVRPGDVVAIVAPSGPVREADLQPGLDRLAERYTLRFDARLRARAGHLAGCDADRLDALRSALGDPDVRAVVAARGGYGVTRILPLLDVWPLRDSPKAVVGSSDLTALSCLLARDGIASVHGPMVETLGRIADPDVFERLVRVMEDPSPIDDSGLRLEAVRPGVASGPVLGGNLSLLAALAGTGTLPDFSGAILFLEDVGERPYRIDRMLTQLVSANVLHGLAGVLVGDVTDCTPRDGEPAAIEVIAERLGPLGIPIVAGYPAGHGARFLAIPIGAAARIDGDAGRIEWLEGAVQ
jgi:muramoyltetrapeptide carboxypeptidase